MKTTLYLMILTSLILGFTTQSNPKKATKEFENKFKLIPSGYLFEKMDSLSIQSFYCSSGEVTNGEYQLFLSDLKNKGRLNDLKIAQVDTNKWIEPLQFNHYLVEHYHDHPAYSKFPVVNISKEGATLYCEWLSNYWSENSEGKINMKFRLPEHSEWKYAASGGIKKAVYSWDGQFVRNEKGHILANFLNLDASSIGRDSLGNLVVHTKDIQPSFDSNKADVLAPVISYYPNGFGLYNMNGNVAELVADKNIVAGGSWKDAGYDIRNASTKPYKGAITNVGFRVVATKVK